MKEQITKNIRLDQLLLSKDEIPIFKDRFFHLPVHPQLLSVKLDPELGIKVFPQAVQEWYAELSAHTERLDSKNKLKKWYQEVFLREEPRIVNLGNYLIIIPLRWESGVYCNEEGFAHSLSIARDAGGSLVNPQVRYVYDDQIRFTPDKFKEYEVPLTEINRLKEKDLSPEELEEHGILRLGMEGMTELLVYGQHNVEFYPGALFLRNWGVLYLNAALREMVGSRLKTDSNREV